MHRRQPPQLVWVMHNPNPNPISTVWSPETDVITKRAEGFTLIYTYWPSHEAANQKVQIILTINQLMQAI